MNLNHANSYELPKPIEPKIEHRGRLRRTANGDRFRAYVLVYEIPEEYQVRLLPKALERNAKVRVIIDARYSNPIDRPEIKSWVDSSVEALESLLPSLEPLKLPKFFLEAGFMIDKKDYSFFKIFMNLDQGWISPADCAEKIAELCYHWGDSHEDIDLESRQDWILDCIASQWRLLRRATPDPASVIVTR